jgi:hypothetical protein
VTSLLGTGKLQTFFTVYTPAERAETLLLFLLYPFLLCGFDLLSHTATGQNRAEREQSKLRTIGTHGHRSQTNGQEMGFLGTILTKRLESYGPAIHSLFYGRIFARGRNYSRLRCLSGIFSEKGSYRCEKCTSCNYMCLHILFHFLFYKVLSVFSVRKPCSSLLYSS